MKNKKVIIAIVAVVAIVAIVIACIFVGKGNKEVEVPETTEVVETTIVNETDETVHIEINAETRPEEEPLDCDHLVEDEIDANTLVYVDSKGEKHVISIDDPRITDEEFELWYNYFVNTIDDLEVLNNGTQSLDNSEIPEDIDGAFSDPNNDPLCAGSDHKDGEDLGLNEVFNDNGGHSEGVAGYDLDASNTGAHCDGLEIVS